MTLNDIEVEIFKFRKTHSKRPKELHVSVKVYTRMKEELNMIKHTSSVEHEMYRSLLLIVDHNLEDGIVVI
jgi:hypothetical protein